ncbi:ribonuclease P protein component [Rhabdaerophilum calidifontis]|uniref:ribonuclease P protein component n=1 Tax=Rhabdaerophilum calidifontis TaxID=2604328 RepID=UPI0012383E6F|nr:ribonuclease P protein component [Rhabdaerophilum calidifontis]
MTGAITDSGTTGEGAGRAEASLPVFRLETIKKRAAFRAAQAGRRVSTPGFTLLLSPEPPPDGAPLRFGFTVTKKIGHAVERNRIRRRLRAAVRAAAPRLCGGAMQLVLIARRPAIDRPFAALVEDMVRAAAALAQLRPGKPGKSPRG